MTKRPKKLQKAINHIGHLIRAAKEGDQEAAAALVLFKERLKTWRSRKAKRAQKK